MKATSAFRGGTVTEASKEHVRIKRKEWREEIASVRQKIEKEQCDVLANPKRKRKSDSSKQVSVGA